MESNESSDTSSPNQDEICKLINLVSLHIVSHPIDHFDIHLAKLLDGNGEIDLLNTYKVRVHYKTL